MVTIEIPSWVEQAACGRTDPSVFFPGRGEDPQEARRICSGCLVREECLRFGLYETVGIWGGLTERERRRLRSGRRSAEHGTRSMYVMGCHCEPCRDANAAYHRQRMSTVKAS